MRVIKNRFYLALMITYSAFPLSAQQSHVSARAPSAFVKLDLPNLEGPDNGYSSVLLEDMLPQAPMPQSPSEDSKISASGKLPSILAPQMTQQPLTAKDKTTLYFHQATNPVALLLPVVGAAFTMANPPKHYPHDWRDGGEAFGRLYGNGLARIESQQAAQILTQVVFQEDPRYLPSTSHKSLNRVSHALVFAIVDRSDAGLNMPALSNFSGAAASGFVGMGYLPTGYNDLTHAGQRSAIAFASYGAGNLANEFCPEWSPIVMKLHLPFVHPPCQERVPAKHP